jgi:hypothetical protein
MHGRSSKPCEDGFSAREIEGRVTNLPSIKRTGVGPRPHPHPEIPYNPSSYLLRSGFVIWRDAAALSDPYPRPLSLSAVPIRAVEHRDRIKGLRIVSCDYHAKIDKRITAEKPRQLRPFEPVSADPGFRLQRAAYHRSELDTGLAGRTDRALGDRAPSPLLQQCQAA